MYLALNGAAHQMLWLVPISPYPDAWYTFGVVSGTMAHGVSDNPKVAKSRPQIHTTDT